MTNLIIYTTVTVPALIKLPVSEQAPNTLSHLCFYPLSRLDDLRSQQFAHFY